MAGKICRRLLALIGLLGCLTLGFFGYPSAAHAASPVWAIRGEHNTVYLAGSVHLLKAQDSKLPAAFDRAYASAKGLVMEAHHAVPPACSRERLVELRQTLRAQASAGGTGQRAVQ